MCLPDCVHSADEGAYFSLPSNTFISPRIPLKITHSLVLYAKIPLLLREILFVRRLSC